MRLPHPVPLVLCLFALILLPVGASAVEETVPDHASFLKNPHFAVLVVTITEAETHKATHQNPPGGTLTVDEILRGRIIPPGTYSYAIEPSRTHADFIPGTNDLKPEWYDRPMQQLTMGGRYIVTTYATQESLEDERFLYLHTSQYVYTEQNQVRVMAQMTAEERSGAVQFPLFLTIVALPFASRKLAGRRKARQQSVGKAPPLMALVAFPLYVFYETGISGYTDIRIDLLLILPALAVAALLLARHGGRYLFGRPEGGG